MKPYDIRNEEIFYQKIMNIVHTDTLEKSLNINT